MGRRQARSTLRDLLALSAIPAIWIERSYDAILSDGLRLIVRSLDADAALARIPAPNGEPLEISYGVQPDLVSILRRDSPLWIASGSRVVSVSEANAAHAVVTRLGTNALAGALIVASERPSFPDELELLFVEAATNQLAVALHGARLTEALHEEQRRKDAFLASLAHELRNPIAAIRSASDALRRVDRESRKRLDDIVDRQSRHLGHVVDDLLDLSRIASGKLTLNLESVDLREVVLEAVETLRTARHGLTQEISCDTPDPIVPVLGDQARLEQIVGNVLSNAIKYTPPGGRIEVVVSSIGGAGVLRVSDNGVGIPSELLPHVFEQFVQSEQTIDRSEGGLGLGLALVRALARAQGGDATAASQGPGCGSVFTVTLPLAEHHPNTDFAAPLAPPGALLRIVLIDDNADIREALAQLLALDGHDVVVASNGEDGIKAIRAHEPDLALVDIGLPVLDGYDVARAIRADSSITTHLVALTGYGLPEDRRRAREAGFDAHLVKPVDHAQLDALFRTYAAQVREGPGSSASVIPK